MKDEQGAKITKEMLRHAIKETASVVLSPPPFMSMGSPLKTPTKLERSPPPNNRNLKELKHLKVQLENERFERNLLEVEVKTNQEKVDSLVKKCRDLSREVQSLRNHQMVESNDENINPNIQRIEHIKAKMEREITARDDKICDLKLEISNLSDCKQNLLEKINIVEKERKELLEKLCDFDESVCALQAEITIRDEKIQYLEQSNEELVQILGEYRQKSVKDISSDCMDFSCSTYHTGMTSADGENLGSVIDLQLKDKESEVSMLKEQLETFKTEKEDLQKIIKDLSSKVSSLSQDIKEHQEAKKTMRESLGCKIDILKEKLKDTMSIHDENSKRKIELEEQLEKEKKFNDQVNKNNEIMKEKLLAEREKFKEIQGKFSNTLKELEKVIHDYEELKGQQSAKILEVGKSYEEKLEGYKEKMASTNFYFTHLFSSIWNEN